MRTSSRARVRGRATAGVVGQAGPLGVVRSLSRGRKALIGTAFIAALVLASYLVSMAPAGTTHVVTTLAGLPGTAGTASASSVTTSAARFYNPSNSAYDSSGNLFVCDTGNQCIRRIDTAGNVTVFAGSTARATGRTNGTGTAARFNNPTGIAIDASNNLYVADSGNNQIRRITPAGAVTLFAGSPTGTAGGANGAGSPNLTTSRFSGPAALAFDPSRANLYVADATGSRLRRIVMSTSTVSTLVTGANAEAFAGIAADASGNVYASLTARNQVRQYSSAGAVLRTWGSTAAGTADGDNTVARFNAPRGLCIDSTYLYVADSGNHAIRRVLLASPYTVTTIAGTAGTAGTANGNGSAALFNGPTGVTLRGASIAVADRGNAALRNINILTTFAIAPAAGANGVITPNATQTVAAGGTSPTFTILPNAGYHIADVLVDGSSVGEVPTYQFTNVTADHTIWAAFAINTYTIAPSAGPGGAISPTTTQTVAYGANLTCSITPNAGYHIANVLVDGASVGTPASYTFSGVADNHTISAQFAIDTFTIAPSAGSGGSIAPSSTVTVGYGGDQTFTPIPNTGYHIASILVDGASVGTPASYTFSNVTANHTISAQFAVNTYTIAPSAGAGGSISPAATQTVPYGGALTCTISPNSGYSIVDVVVDGVSRGAISSHTFANVTANHTISATFASNTRTIVPSAGFGGAISPTTTQTVAYGGNQTFTISPNTGYRITDVVVDGSSIGTPTAYTFTNVTANHTISATFASSTFVISVAAGANGSISPLSPPVAYGADQTFLITPNTGYHVQTVAVDGVPLAIPVLSYTFYSVTAPHTLSATFASDTRTLSYAAGAHGTISGTASQTVTYGGSGSTVTAVANTGYHFVSWSDGVTTATRTDSNVTANINVTANFASNTLALSYAAGAHGSISGTASQTVAYGGSGSSVTAVANTGYHFVSWSDGVTTATRTDSNVTANINVTAAFASNTLALSYAAGAHGTISGTASQTVAYGGSGSSVTAVAYTGYVFVSWSDGVTTATRTDSNVTANINVTANFAANTMTLSYAAGARGTISGTASQTVAYGGSGSTVTAVANTGYHFVSWSDGVTTATRTDSNVTANINVTANFAANTMTLSYAAGGHGTITGAASQTVTYGGSGSTVTAVPDAGYHFVSWSDGLTTASRTDSNVTANINVTADFASNVLTVASATAASTNQVDVVFSVPVQPSTVQAADFSVVGLTISSAAVQADGLTVRLTGATQVPGTVYSAVASSGSITSIYGTSLIAPNSATFVGHAGPWTGTNAPHGVQVDFSLVVSAGSIDVSVPSVHKAPPAGCTYVPGTYFDISTSANFDGNEGFIITVPYDPANVTGDPSDLALLHQEAGLWANITTSVDTVHHTVTGRAHSFSDYVIVQGGGVVSIPTSTPASSLWSLAFLGLLGVALAVTLARGVRSE